MQLLLLSLVLVPGISESLPDHLDVGENSIVPDAKLHEEVTVVDVVINEVDTIF